MKAEGFETGRTMKSLKSESNGSQKMSFNWHCQISTIQAENSHLGLDLNICMERMNHRRS